MAHKKKGQLTGHPFRKHLRKHIKGRIGWKRLFWKQERSAVRRALSYNSKFEL